MLEGSYKVVKVVQRVPDPTKYDQTVRTTLTENTSPKDEVTVFW